MNNKFVGKFLFWLIPLVVAALWLLSLVIPATFGWFNLAYVVIILGVSWGVIYLVKGLLTKNVSVIKNFDILIAIGLFIIAFVFGVLKILNVQSEIVAAIIVVLVLLIPVLTIVANRGKKWDSGDNEKTGYKNYYQRKEEEKKNNQ